MEQNYYRSYDDVMEKLLFRIPDGLDTREGSLLQICLSAAAIQISQMTAKLDMIYNNFYADTAEGEYLDKICKILGTERRGATRAIVKVTSDVPLYAGLIISANGVKYKVTEANESYGLAECQTAGSIGNVYLGDASCEENIPSLTKITITEIVAAGKEAEDDSSLRERFFSRAKYPVCAGNLSYYREALNEMSGTGGVKIFPVANGAGTVRVVITGVDGTVPSEALIKNVQEKLDPTDFPGEGRGIAPIGHTVKVEGVKSVDIDVKVKMTVPSGNVAGVLRYARRDIPLLFQEVNKNWSKVKSIVLRDSFFEDYFLENTQVDDIEIISINGEANRLILKENEILGGFTISEFVV